MRLLRDMTMAGLLALSLALPARAEDPGAMALALAATQVQDWVTARDAARAAGPLGEALEPDEDEGDHEHAEALTDFLSMFRRA